MPYPDLGGDTRIRIVSTGSFVNPQVGDIWTIKLGRNINASDFTMTQTRNGTPTNLTLVGMQHTVDANDKPAIGGSWPLMANANNLSLSSTPINVTNPATAPSVTSSPSVTGVPVVNMTANFTPGTYGGSPAPTVVRRWLVDGVVMATAASYTPSPGDRGKTLTIQETATNSAGSVVATSAGALIGALISMSTRQGIPASVGNVSASAVNDNYRIWDFALQPVTVPSMGFANMASYPNIPTSGAGARQQEQPNISPVYITCSILTNVDQSLGLDQSVATLTMAAWTKAMAGTPGKVWKLVGNNRVNVSAAEFAAAGAVTSNGGATLLCPGGYYAKHDDMPGVFVKGWWARQVEFRGVPPVTLTIPPATYTAGTSVPYSGGTPVNGWTYLATGTGVPAVTTNPASEDQTGTVASVSSSGVLTLSKDFTSTGGTITLTSRWPVVGTNGAGTATTGDFRKFTTTPNLAVGVKDWSTISPSSTNGSTMLDLCDMTGTNTTGARCMLVPETSLANGNHDRNADGSWGDVYGATGAWRRACTLTNTPSIKTAVSGSSMHNEVPSAAFPGANYGPLKQFLAGYCDDMLLSGPYNTRAWVWAGGTITASAGGKLMYQSYTNSYRTACRQGASTQVYMTSMLPGASGTFATEAGQNVAADNLDATKMQINQRAYVNSPGTWVPANGDPNFGIDILPGYYSDALASGFGIPGADVPTCIASGKHPYSADWSNASNSSTGYTWDGVHTQRSANINVSIRISYSIPMQPA